MAITQITRSLDELWEAWREKFSKMNGDSKFAGKLTEPHITFKPDGYDSQPNTVLYVGKALRTQDTCDGDPPSAEELRKESRRFLEDVFSGKYGSAFWNFALDLAKKTAGRDYDETRPLQNLVWSNICKIGAWNGKDMNPKGDAFVEQRDLAVETLRAEIECYKPSLVVWVTHDYGVKSEHDVGVIGEITGEADPISWKRELEDTWLWWRDRTNSSPPMVWTGHPQFKQKHWDTWVRKACELVDLKIS